MRTRLNGLQQMMLRWEDFHPLNAVHVIQFGLQWPVEEIHQAVVQICGSLGLKPVEFDKQRVNIEFFEQSSTVVETAPQFSHIQFEGPAYLQIESCVNDQLNWRFDEELHWPIRFCLLDSVDGGQFLVVSYQHAISDSRGVSIIIREIIRCLSGWKPLISNLNFNPPSLQTLFPEPIGASSWLKRCKEIAEQIFVGTNCFRPQRIPGEPRRIVCGLPWQVASTEVLIAVSRNLKSSVHALVSGAVLEALGLHFYFQIQAGRRKDISIYAPVDLRQAAGGHLDNAMGQLLSAMTSHAAVHNGGAFRKLVSEVQKQQTVAKLTANQCAHTSHMSFMARLWDFLPSSINEIAGPALVPQAGFVSNVNLTDFLEEEIREGLVINYSRFSGTGLMTPMMLGITTTGSTYQLTSTHHSDVFNSADIRRILSHVQWRLDGNIEEPISLNQFALQAEHPQSALLNSL